MEKAQERLSEITKDRLERDIGRGIWDGWNASGWNLRMVKEATGTPPYQANEHGFRFWGPNPDAPCGPKLDYGQMVIETNEKEMEFMATLFEVFIVCVKDQRVAFRNQVVADNDDMAKMKVLGEAVTDGLMDTESLDGYDFLVRPIGAVRKPER